MVYEVRKQSMAWMENGLQISFKRFALSMEDKMVEDLGALGIMGETALFSKSVCRARSLSCTSYKQCLPWIVLIEKDRS